MKLTINTDASFCPNEKVGGFAFWIKCNQFTFKGSGIIKNPENSSDSELKAVCNALYLLKKRYVVEKITTVYINTDSKYVIQWIKKKNDDPVTNLIWEILNTYNPDEVLVRHVKAHSHTKTARHFVNQWCDDMARIEMKKQRI